MHTGDAMCLCLCTRRGRSKLPPFLEAFCSMSDDDKAAEALVHGRWPHGRVTPIRAQSRLMVMYACPFQLSAERTIWSWKSYSSSSPFENAMKFDFQHIQHYITLLFPKMVGFLSIIVGNQAIMIIHLESREFC